MTTLLGNLVDLSDFAWQRLRNRLEGLTDEEYLWEPVSECWTVCRGEDGSYEADGARLPPEPPPFTTLAWRVTHLIDVLQAERTATWFGHRPSPQDGLPGVPGSAADALRALEHAYDVWRRRLAGLSEDDLVSPMGPIAGPYAEQDGTAFALHILDELIHHGAEIGVVRDLYRQLGPRDPFVLACVRGDRAEIDTMLEKDPALLERTRAEHPALLVEAAALQRWAAVQVLVELGFDVNARSASGRVPAHYAAGTGHVDTLRMLVGHGADLTVTDSMYQATPLGWAQWFGQEEAAGYLQRHQAA
ncbi:DinB family protein [Nonomuraea sp. NPDC049784]|uniref:DinB family protein n=1 Tax=Nonomuraea sp. NPDC049784 TaxID=3154361 RepID=UPI0033F50D22